MEFAAIDVETSNANRSSICQIGIAVFCGYRLVDEWVSLVNPEDYFDAINVGIHGIDEAKVRSAPTIRDIYPAINAMLTDKICVSHTSFDRISINRALQKAGLPSIECKWLDSARVARRTWQECAFKGFGLKNVCKIIGHEFKHHDALEDAKAAGFIVNAAIAKTQIQLQDWPRRINQPIAQSIAGSASDSIARDGNPEGDLYGSVIAFTGALDVPRREAAEMAARVGCTVTDGVSKKIDYLVVGDQDVSRLAGKDKSTKHLKAEQLIQSGASICILTESDFFELVGLAVQA
jgi:DNA polymerase III subunit epsilon